jgi:hypothetical protein
VRTEGGAFGGPLGGELPADGPPRKRQPLKLSEWDKVRSAAADGRQRWERRRLRRTRVSRRRLSSVGRRRRRCRAGIGGRQLAWRVAPLPERHLVGAGRGGIRPPRAGAVVASPAPALAPAAGAAAPVMPSTSLPAVAGPATALPAACAAAAAALARTARVPAAPRSVGGRRQLGPRRA